MVFHHFWLQQNLDFQVNHHQELTQNIKKKTLAGLLTNRDIQCFKFNDELVKDFMTPI